MHLRKGKLKNGDMHISICQSYRNDEGKPDTKTIKTLGKLSALEKKWGLNREDTLKKCKSICDKITQEYNSIKRDVIEISYNKPVDKRTTNRKNLGSSIVLAFYNALGIEKVIRNITTDTKLFSQKKYDINSVLRLLVVERLLNSSSVLKAWNNKEKYFFKTSFSLDDMYRAYDCFAYNKERIIRAINTAINKMKIRKGFGTVFYDVTNYYFETDEQTDEVHSKSDYLFDDDDNIKNIYDDAYYELSDEEIIEKALIKYGHEKTGRKNPIIQMGLLQDRFAIPITYKLFPGNTNDYTTMLPMLQQMKKDYKLGRVVVVADKGNNTSTNIAACLAKGDGFIFSQSIRGTKSTKSLRDWVLESDEYRKKGSNFKIKSKIDTKIIHLKPEDTASGKAETQEVNVKVVAFWSKKYQVRARKIRQKTIDKAYEYISSTSKYETAINYGAAKYVKGIDYNKETGEVIETGKTLEFNNEVLQEEMAADGYYCIITSEINMSDNKIIEMYRGLWQIEETFKISKTDLSVRPVRVRTNSHIRGHFLICYIALTLIRVLQHYLHNKFSAKKLIEEMRSCCGSLATKNIWLFDYRTDLLDTMFTLIGKEKQMKWMKLSEIKKYFYKVEIPKYSKSIKF